MSVLEHLQAGQSGVWLRSQAPRAPRRKSLTEIETADAASRFDRFAPVLAALFAENGWDGRIHSDLLDYPLTSDLPRLLVKADHQLPMTGSVKARGGVYELLCWIEDIVVAAGLAEPGGDLRFLTDPVARELLAGHRIVVASTGNLGFSIGLVARAFGAACDVHMSHEAKAWKKDRLKRLGVRVIEHQGDYTHTVAHARAAAQREGAYFVDDEYSRRLFVGYSVAARELAAQIAQRNVQIDAERPLIVYLPCGVGGAPGGIAAGLDAIYGPDLIIVFVEPIASACMLVALAEGGKRPVSVYDVGLNNHTIADGLAVPTASALVLEAIGDRIDAVVGVTDAAMLDWVRGAWRDARLRLEPSAASGFAAVAPFIEARRATLLPVPAGAVHVVWATGGAHLPHPEFQLLLTS